MSGYMVWTRTESASEPTVLFECDDYGAALRVSDRLVRDGLVKVSWVAPARGFPISEPST